MDMDRVLPLIKDTLIRMYGEARTEEIMRRPDIKFTELVRSLSKASFSFFCQTFLPSYFSTPYGPMHYEVADDLERAMKSSSGWRQNTVWPRGFGKTTHLVTGLAIWSCALRKRPYMLIVKDSYETQAVPEVEAIREELETNKLLKQFWGPFKSRRWSKGTIVTSGKWPQGGIKIQALGAGMKIRGLKHGPYRPGIVVMDDLENLENVESKAQRKKTRDWHDRSALKAGLRAGEDPCIYLDIGSNIHSDCLVANLLKRPLWKNRFWKAELSLATNQMLWDQWKAVICNLADDDRIANGRRFFESHQEEMLVGAEVSWPQGFDYYKLQMLKIGEQKIGETKVSAFNAEMQNEPISAEDRIFRVLHYYNIVDRDGELWLVPEEWGKSVKLKDCDFYGACDPSMGGIGSDYSAIGIMAVAPWNQKFVLVADLERRAPDRIIDDMIRYAASREVEAFGIEAVGFQKLLYTDACQAAMEAEAYIPFTPIPATGNKTTRIASLQPDLANGYILLNRKHVLLNEQLEEFPKSAFDDGPDMLEMLSRICSLAGAGGGVMF